MEGKEMQEYGHGAIVNIEDYAMSTEALIGQVRLIQDVMSKVMRDNEHYGVIPGTSKPTLLKPGAEKLCLLFRFDPDYEIIREVREDMFIAYTVKCALQHIPTGQFIATGIGSCNSRETKYRYRSEVSGVEVPKEYWKNRDPALIGGTQFTTRKKDGKWYVAQQVENDNPWDLDNTLIKMACKRALVAATLNATAASDIFTQDMEDMPQGAAGGATNEKKKTTVTRKSEGKQKASGNTAHESLTAELDTYCKGDKAFRADVLREISLFVNDKGEEVYMRNIPSAGKNEKWVGSALGKLRKMAQEQTTEDAFDITTPADIKGLFIASGYTEEQILPKIATILQEQPKPSMEDYKESELKAVKAWMVENEG